ncbi:hypothetical protein AN948_01885 [Rhodococcus sp. ADH]|nr:hypothetical protein AN948_01885 [Rhodococcus sp. ADH]
MLRLPSATPLHGDQYCVLVVVGREIGRQREQSVATGAKSEPLVPSGTADGFGNRSDCRVAVARVRMGPGVIASAQ